jgi:hypothetical protein
MNLPTALVAVDSASYANEPYSLLVHFLGVTPRSSLNVRYVGTARFRPIRLHADGEMSCCHHVTLLIPKLIDVNAEFRGRLSSSRVGRRSLPS